MSDDRSRLVHHVDATFGGRPVRFHLDRDREAIEALEQAVGSVSATWGRFRSGDWTMRDVRSILVLAYPRPDKPTDALQCFLPPRALSGTAAEGVEDYIDSVIATRPLATYASLAGAVLTSAFTGLPIATAVFDENGRLIGSTADGLAP